MIFNWLWACFKGSADEDVAVTDQQHHSEINSLTSEDIDAICGVETSNEIDMATTTYEEEEMAKIVVDGSSPASPKQLSEIKMENSKEEEISNEDEVLKCEEILNEGEILIDEHTSKNNENLKGEEISNEISNNEAVRGKAEVLKEEEVLNEDGVLKHEEISNEVEVSNDEEISNDDVIEESLLCDRTNIEISTVESVDFKTTESGKDDSVTPSKKPSVLAINTFSTPDTFSSPTCGSGTTPHVVIMLPETPCSMDAFNTPESNHSVCSQPSVETERYDSAACTPSSAHPLPSLVEGTPIVSPKASKLIFDNTPVAKPSQQSGVTPHDPWYRKHHGDNEPINVIERTFSARIESAMKREAIKTRNKKSSVFVSKFDIGDVTDPKEEEEIANN